MEDAASPGALAGGALRLLLMFNVAGDPSPLHSLRGEPMLDVVTAALFVLGVGLALARWRDGGSLAILAWLIAALAVAAVVGRNAQPDSLAALHALTPALLLAGGALAATAGGPQARHIAHTSLPLDLALLLVLVIVGINGHALFVRRPADAAAWTAYASPEALAAREIGKLTPTHTIYLADVWLDDPTIRFLARWPVRAQAARPGHHPAATSRRVVRLLRARQPGGRRRRPGAPLRGR